MPKTSTSTAIEIHKDVPQALLAGFAGAAAGVLTVESGAVAVAAGVLGVASGAAAAATGGPTGSFGVATAAAVADCLRGRADGRVG